MFAPQNRVVLGLLLTVALTSGEIRNRGWWNHTVFYQVYPRSFMDANGDGVGDLKGIRSQLKHFVKSGVGAICLSPINQSPMADLGYDISDFKDIHKIFGTLEDLKDLLTQAKEFGLKVILDLVPNHTSDKHYWFTSSTFRDGKYENYYIWVNGRNGNKEPPNNWLSVYGGSAWTYNSIREQWYLHQFGRRQPDLNYSNPYVQEEMTEIIQYWLGKGVDGFRINAVSHLFETNFTSNEPTSNLTGVTKNDYNYLEHTLTKDQPQTYELVRSWRKILDDYASQTNTDEKVMMSEAYTSLENAVKYYDYGSHIPFNFNFIRNVNANSGPTVFKDIIDKWITAKPKNGTANWVLGNNEHSRVATRLPGRVSQMTMLVMVLPGVAVTYYGDEIGMFDKKNISWQDTQDPVACGAGESDYARKSRDPFRTPFQWNMLRNAGFSNNVRTWLPVHENFGFLNLAIQTYTNEPSFYKEYCALTALRNSNTLKFGSLTTDIFNDTVLLVLRKTSEEAMTLLINFSDKHTQVVNLTTILKGYKNSTIKIASMNSGMKSEQTIKLEKINLRGGASIIVSSQISNKSSNYIASLQTILLSTFFSIIMLYK